MPRAVVWDMDGTLINSEEYHWISWRDTMKKEGIAVTHMQFLSSFGQRNDSIIPRWLGAASTPERMERIANAKEELYRDMVRKNGASPLPGVASWVLRLHERGWLQAVASSAPVPTSRWSLKLSRLLTVSRRLSLLNMSARENRILEFI